MWIPSTPIDISSSLYLSNVFFMSLTQTSIVCTKNFAVEITCCMFTEVTQLTNASCLRFQNLKSSSVSKSIAQKCYSYAATVDGWSDGQFCDINLQTDSTNRNDFTLSSVSLCSPIFSSEKRRTVCNIAHGNSLIQNINMSNNYLYRQILLLKTKADINYVSLAKNYLNSLDFLFRDMTASITHISLTNNVYPSTEPNPCVLLFEGQSSGTISDSIFVVEKAYTMGARTGCFVKISNSYLGTYSISSDSSISVSSIKSKYDTFSLPLIRDIANDIFNKTTSKKCQISRVVLSILLISLSK